MTYGALVLTLELLFPFRVTKARGRAGASGVEGGDRSRATVAEAELQTVKDLTVTLISSYGSMLHSFGMAKKLPSMTYIKQLVGEF